MYKKYFKRLFDLILSLFLIILFLPVMFLIFFLVWYFIGFPIFKHKRPGLNNKIFSVYKFKTLYDSKKKNLYKKSKLGNFLRKSGLDELPQLFNVLGNTMSIVGPRPLLVKYLKIKSFRNNKRKNCLPGITGLFQVETFNKSIKKKRNSKWKDQFTLDKKYVENVSFVLDLIIIFKTVLKMINPNSYKIDYYNEKTLYDKYIK